MNALKYIRKQKKMSQKGLVNVLEVQFIDISRYEKGSKLPSIKKQR